MSAKAANVKYNEPNRFLIVRTRRARGKVSGHTFCYCSVVHVFNFFADLEMCALSAVYSLLHSN